MAGVGFAVSAGDPDYRVEIVYPRTDAERQGVRVGDFLHAIDGVPVAELPPRELLAKLTGPIGSTHAYEFGCPTCGGFAGIRVIAIDDLLPLAP